MQTKLDEVVHELFPSGLRFEGERVTLTKQMRTALNGVAEILLEHKQVLRVNIEAYPGYESEDATNHPLRDRQPMDNTGISRSAQLGASPGSPSPALPVSWPILHACC